MSLCFKYFFYYDNLNKHSNVILIWPHTLIHLVSLLPSGPAVETSANEQRIDQAVERVAIKERVSAH